MGYVVAGYAITFAALAAYGWRVLRRGRRIAGSLDPGRPDPAGRTR